MLVFFFVLGEGISTQPPCLPFGSAYYCRILRASRSAWLFAGIVALSVTLAGCGRGDSVRARSGAEWQELLGATQDAQHAGSQQIGTLLQKSLRKDSPMWPVDTFLRAELYQLRGDNSEARKAYGALAEWSAQDPYQDGWGGDGLAAIALWRWIEIADVPSGVEQEEASRIFNCAQKLRTMRLYRGMFSAPLLGTLPQVEEESVRGLAQLAWLAGRKNEAERFFLNYLQVARTKDRNKVENEIWLDLVKTGQASEDRLTLLVAIRLSALGQKETARTMLRLLLGSNDAYVRAEAGYQLALIEHDLGHREIALSLLSSALEDAADPLLFQQILFERAMTYNQRGKGRDSEQFKQDLLRLIDEFPNGSLADNALYELGRYFQQIDDVDQAEIYFKRLQSIEENNNRFELSYYQAVLALYTRGAPGDTDRATQLLKDLLLKRPNAGLRSAALFWLGRLTEEGGDTKQAENYLRKVVEEDSYDYYGIRARMHLNLGSDARLRLLPDEKTKNQLASAYQASLKDVALPVDSPYADRLREVLQNGLYRSSLDADAQLRRLYRSRRLEDLTPDELISSGTLARVSMLLGFRQDAQAAADSRAKDRLPIAIAVGQLGQDWPQAIALCRTKSDPNDLGPSSRIAAGCLSAAYPVVFQRSFVRYGTTNDVAPELLYALVRRESSFYPSALSSVGALGLFQFTPSTFASLDERWKLLKGTGVSSYEEYVLHPDRSIELAARWYHEELLPRYHSSIVPAVVEQNTGRPRMVEWIQKLPATGRSEDIEYAVESVPYLETRLFLRGVITDFAIITSAGVLGRDPEQRPFGPPGSPN
jgi:soluble lytic murein transglycosylase-like protein